MKLLRILQIIKEEVGNWFDDDDQSNLDAYNNKFMSTQAPSTAPSTAPSQPKVDGELIGYVTKEWTRDLPVPIPIYKNPRSLIGVGVDARGVLLNNGDIYLAPSANAMHQNILSVLGEKGIIPYAKTYHYSDNYPEEFVAVQRVKTTNTFAQSSAYDEFPEYYQQIFQNGTQKHPFQFKAYPVDNINELESPLDPMNQYSNIPPGHDANILYENGVNKINKQIAFNMKENKVEKVVKSVLNEFLNENFDEAQIQITPVEQDERSGKKQINAYSVNYQKNVNGELIEIEGTLNPHHTGRNVEYGFEIRNKILLCMGRS